MRRRCAVMAAVLVGVALILSGCAVISHTYDQGGGGAKAKGGIDVGVGTITPKDTKRIAVFVQSSPAYSYGRALAKGAQQEAARLGYHADIVYDNLNAGTELSGFQQAIASGKYGGIILEPFNTQLCVPMRVLAKRYRVLVEIVGTPLCDKGPGSGKALWSRGTISYIGGQNNVPGIEQVLKVAATKQKGPQKAAFIFGPNGYASDVAWQAAWKPFAAKHANWKLVATQYGDFTTPTSFQLTQNALSGHGDITVFFDPYIDVTVGVAKAVSQSGKKIAIYDNGGGSVVARKLVTQGRLTGDLPTYPRSLGVTGVKNLVAALHGHAPPRFVAGDGNPAAGRTGVLTAQNIGRYTPQW